MRKYIEDIEYFLYELPVENILYFKCVVSYLHYHNQGDTDFEELSREYTDDGFVWTPAA